MSLFKLTIRMQTYMLAKHLDDPKFASMPATFMRDEKGRPGIPHPCWFKALNDTLRATGIRLPAKQLRINPAFYGNCIMHQVPHRSGAVTVLRVHEAVAPGESVVFHGAMVVHMDTNLLYDTLEHLGKFVGLTPFGHHLGYGRFDIEELQCEKEIDYAEAIEEKSRPLGGAPGTTAADIPRRGQSEV